MAKKTTMDSLIDNKKNCICSPCSLIFRLLFEEDMLFLTKSILSIFVCDVHKCWSWGWIIMFCEHGLLINTNMTNTNTISFEWICLLFCKSDNTYKIETVQTKATLYFKYIY